MSSIVLTEGMKDINRSSVNLSISIRSYNNLNGSQVLCDLTVHEWYIISLVLISAIAALTTALFGNMVVLIAMVKFRSLQSPSMLLVGTLSVANMLMSLVVTPIYIVGVLNPNARWRYWVREIVLVSVLVCLLTETYISIDRLLRVFYLRKYNPSGKRLLSGRERSWIHLSPWGLHRHSTTELTRSPTEAAYTYQFSPRSNTRQLLRIYSNLRYTNQLILIFDPQLGSPCDIQS